MPQRAKKQDDFLGWRNFCRQDFYYETPIIMIQSSLNADSRSGIFGTIRQSFAAARVLIYADTAGVQKPDRRVGRALLIKANLYLANSYNHNNGGNLLGQ